jgi:O-antigen/teichoic acid export membrane protein
MSSLQRFLSASAAAWVRIFLAGLSQALLVPVFLSHWSVEQYGCWLIIQSIVSVGSILSLSYQNFIGFELLKIGDGQPRTVRLVFYSALPLVVMMALIELSGLGCLIYFGFIGDVFDATHTLNPQLLGEALWSLIIYSLSWLISSSIAGLAWRTLVLYGHYPRMAWWNTYIALVTALTSGLAVSCGAGLLWTVIWITAAVVAASIPFYLDLWQKLRHHGLFPITPDWKLGLHHARLSLAIAATAALDISRQQGVRIFLSALVGIREMTTFSTIRVISNVSQQGVGTITNPVMPEIMKFLRNRDSERIHATVGLVWLLAVVLLAPVLVVLQWIVPMVFQVWTRGKIEFNPQVFGLFSILILLFSVARPAATILQGNNLLKDQLLISIAMFAAAVPGILLLTPKFGIAGTAAAMLLAELLGATLTLWCASRWLTKTGIAFPVRVFAITLASIIFASSAISLMVWVPRSAPAAAIISIIAGGFLCIALVRQLPPAALGRLRRAVQRILPRVHTVG